LEDKAQRQEKSLLTSEEKLKKDADQFERYLKENDESAQAAIQLADVEAAKKQRIIQQIKKLQGEVVELGASITKQEELLTTCKEYKDFLDKLTPPEHFEKFRRDLADQQRKTREENHKKRFAEYEVLLAQYTTARNAKNSKKDSKKGERGGRRLESTEDEEEDEEVKMAPPSRPRLEDEPMPPLEERDPPMYIYALCNMIC
jgi:glycine cleavage system H lipoate-binding protein